MSPTPELAIDAIGLNRAFGTVPALDHLDLTVPRGGVHGVLGPNGAGKTTAIRILSTLLEPDSGRATVLGHDVVHEPQAVRARIGVTGQFASVDTDLTGQENLVLAGRLRGLDRSRARTRAHELLEVFDLLEAGRRQARHYSGGMLRRLDIAASLVTVPELLFLDEPTTGLDPHSRGQVWDIVRALVANGTTVVLTTQYLDEADRLADRIAVIDRGRVIAEGTSGQLKASVGAGTLHLRVADPATRDRAGRLITETVGRPTAPGTDPTMLGVRVAEPSQATRVLVRLHEADIAVTQFGLDQPSLDEVFLSLTGKTAEPRPSDPEAAA